MKDEDEQRLEAIDTRLEEISRLWRRRSLRNVISAVFFALVAGWQASDRAWLGMSLNLAIMLLAGAVAMDDLGVAREAEKVRASKGTPGVGGDLP